MKGDGLKRLINDVGMAVFVKYYWTFKELDRDKAIAAIEESITEKSKGTRTSKAHRVFKENVNIDVLTLIIDSIRVDDITLTKAREILAIESMGNDDK